MFTLTTFVVLVVSEVGSTGLVGASVVSGGGVLLELVLED